MLRVLRFNSRYDNSTIAPEVLEAMKNQDIQSMVIRKLYNRDEQHGIVPERTAEEFRKIMKGAQPEICNQNHVRSWSIRPHVKLAWFLPSFGHESTQ